MSGTISALKVQKRNPRRVNVYLDGEFVLGLARITAAWLQVGQFLSDEKLAELEAQDGAEEAYQRALSLLERRVRSSEEIRRRLQAHAFPEEVIDGVVGRLLANGLVDDTRFAQEWIENRSTFRPRSRRALSVELRLKGLPDEAIAEAVEAVDDEGLAYQAALKYSRKLSGFEWVEFRRKMSAFLARRGFDYETAITAVRRVWDELNSGQQEAGE